jgi:hypothetical protein
VNWLWIPSWVGDLALIPSVLAVIVSVLIAPMAPRIFQKYLVPAQVISILMLCWAVYAKGLTSERQSWISEVERQNTQIALLQAESLRTNQTVITEYVIKERVVRQQAQTVIEYVDRWITPQDNEACVIPPGFVELHNRAAEIGRENP